MSFNTGINRVFLMGNVSDDPAWQIMEGQRVLCFNLTTTEQLRKGNKPYEHTEWHRIRIPADIIKNDMHIQINDLLYIQGKIQTRVVFENDVKLYRTDVLVTSIERLKTASRLMHAV